MHLWLEFSQYDLKGKEYLNTNVKYFVGDLGLRHAVLGYKDSDISGMLENIAYLELLRNDYKVYIGKLGNKKVDFVAEKEDERIYIHVSYIMNTPQTITREFAVLESIRDNYPKFVISLDPLQIRRESGIKHINLYDFLLKGLISLWNWNFVKNDGFVNSFVYLFVAF